MTFVPKTWTNTSETLLDAPAMIDLEQRLADYVDDKSRDPGRPGLQYVVENPGQNWIQRQDIDVSGTPPDRIEFTLPAPRLVLFAVQLNGWHPSFGQHLIVNSYLDGTLLSNERGLGFAGQLGAAVKAGAIGKIEPIANGMQILINGGGITNQAPFPDMAKVFNAWLPAGDHDIEIKYRSSGGDVTTTGGYIENRRLVVIL